MPKTRSVVTYKTANSARLRYVLWQLWNSQCYWCHQPKDFTDTEIDHILPQSISPTDLKTASKKFALPDDFDLDDVANLAPACGRCNGKSGKAGKVLLDRPVVIDQLDKAARLRPRVLANYDAFVTDSKLIGQLLSAAQTDLRHTKTRALFLEHAPAVVQRLALVAPERLDYQTASTVHVVNRAGEATRVDVSFDDLSRRAVVILEDVCHTDLDDVIREPVLEMVATINDEVMSSFVSINHHDGPIDVGPPSPIYEWFTITEIRHELNGDDPAFTVRGGIEGSYSCSLSQIDVSGDGLHDFQGDAYVVGTFTFSTTATVAGGAGQLDPDGDPEIVWEAFDVTHDL